VGPGRPVLDGRAAHRFANDPANLLAVEGKANRHKGDGQPAEWMPPNQAFWCQYAVQFP
jgi:hypothetical protein